MANLRTVANQAGAISGIAQSALAVLTGALGKDEGLVLVDGAPLPCIVTRCAIPQAERVEDVEVRGRSGAVPLLKGLGVRRVQVTLVCVNDINPGGLAGVAIGAARNALGALGALDGDGPTTALEKIAAIQQVFIARNADATKKIYALDNILARATGISEVFVEGFDVSYANQNNAVYGDLTLRETESSVARYIEAAAGAPQLLKPLTPGFAVPSLDTAMGAAAGAAEGLLS